MLTRSEKVILAGLLLFNLVLWGFFGTALFCFHDSFSFSSDFFHAMTSLDWDLAAQGAHRTSETFDSALSLVGIVAIVLNGLGLWMLSAPEYEHAGRPLLPIPRKWLFRIPWSALELYIPCYLYIKYYADYFRVWMHLIPQIFQSAAYLVLLAIGFYQLRKQCQAKD